MWKSYETMENSRNSRTSCLVNACSYIGVACNSDEVLWHHISLFRNKNVGWSDGAIRLLACRPQSQFSQYEISIVLDEGDDNQRVKERI